MKVGIINYGLGNISAFEYAFQRLNCKVFLAENPVDIFSSTHLIPVNL